MTACGGSGDGVDVAAFERACAEVPGCAEPAAEASQETIFRVQVIRGASGEIEIGEIEPVDVLEGDGVPVGRLAGSHVVVGLDADGEPVDGQVIAFPEVLRAVPVDDWDGVTEIDLGDRDVDAFGYVRALEGIDELAVRDVSGAVVARAPVPSGGTADAGRPGPAGRRPISLATGLLPAALVALQPGGGSPPPLPAHCSHARIVEGEAERHLARNVSYADEVEILAPGPTQRAVIHGALGLMTPLLCHGVARIVVGDVPSQPGLGGQVKQLASGDLLLINVAAGYTEAELAASAERRLRMMQTVIHETAHGAEALLNASGSPRQDFTGEWTPPSRPLAEETIENVRLEKGLIDEWQLVHRSFERQEWARAYAQNSGPEGSPERKAAVQAARDRSGVEAVKGGFMSRYAAKNYAEDIADTVVWTYLGDRYRAAGIPSGRGQTEDYACQRMRAHGGDGVPSEFAAVYTKLHFLKDLGLVKPGDVDDCTGSVGLPNDAPGFHFWQGGDYQRTFGRGVTAVIGTAPSGNYVYEMKAEGEAAFGDETYPARARLVLELAPGGAPLEKVSWPRGVYDLGLLAGYDLGKLANLSKLVRGSGFSLRLEGKAAGSFDVYDGFALVAEASNDRIAGSLFIRRAWRLQAPLPVPQTFDPPLVVRFAIEN